MVRIIAASTYRVRNQLRLKPATLYRWWKTHAQGPHPSQMLDKIVPCLAVLFLMISSIASYIQFTSSRDTILSFSEQSLIVAARLAASEYRKNREAGLGSEEAIRRLAPEIHQPGRRFVVVGEAGKIEAASHADIPTGAMLAGLFTPGLDLQPLKGNSTLQRVPLANGALASILSSQLGLPGQAQPGALITYHAVDDELLAWRHYAGVIGSLLISFGAITVAFTAVYYAQRAKTKSAGRQVSALQAQFETALDRGHCGLWTFPLKQDEMMWSSSMFGLLGMKALDSSLNIREITARLHPDDISPLTLAQDIQQQGKREIDHLFRMQHEDRGWIWLRMRAVLVQDSPATPTLLGIVMDVTAEREMEEESHRANARLRDAIESIPEVFVLWDENRRLVLCNSKYQSFHGLDTSLVQRGTKQSAILAQCHAPRVMIELEQGVHGCNRAFEAQFQDGRWLLISERHTRDGGYVSVGKDITARKAQEESLIENERALRMTINDLATSREAIRKQAEDYSELANRYLEQKAQVISANQAKAEFLANMNHEMRTPLNHIIGFAEVIEGDIFGAGATQRYRDYAAHIRASGNHLMGLVDDIIEMATIEAGRVGLTRAPHAIAQILEDAADLVADDAAAKDISLSIEPDTSDKAGQKLVFVDAGAIGQVLSHLLRNAIRLSKIAGHISMRARMQGDHINIFIADNSSCLTMEEIGAITHPFGHIDGMLENGCKGSGLGVAIARALIELHGGSLRMRSSPQHGSLMMIHLPVAQQPVQLSLFMS